MVELHQAALVKVAGGYAPLMILQKTQLAAILMDMGFVSWESYGV